MSDSHGKFVWYELMTTDTAGAATFYRNVVGWSAQDAGMPDMSYTILSVGKTPVGGLMAVPEGACKAGARPGWIGYVGVDDVDARAAQLSEDGGTVHRPPGDIPGRPVRDDRRSAGRDARPVQGHGRGSGSASGTRHSGTCRLARAARRKRGSRVRLLRRLVRMDEGRVVRHGSDGHLPALRHGRRTGRRHDDEARVHARTLLALLLQCRGDRRRGGARMGRGGQILNGPHQVPDGSWIVQCRDPQGAMFALVGPRG
jgi:uncharacterized protein